MTLYCRIQTAVIEHGDQKLLIFIVPSLEARNKRDLAAILAAELYSRRLTPGAIFQSQVFSSRPLPPGLVLHYRYTLRLTNLYHNLLGIFTRLEPAFEENHPLIVYIYIYITSSFGKMRVRRTPRRSTSKDRSP